MFGGLLSGATSYLGGLLGFSPANPGEAAPDPQAPQAQPNAGLLAALSPDQQRMLQQFRVTKAFGEISAPSAPMPALLPTPDIFAHRRAGRM